ncbi:hypothetical protein B0T26DRAFT_186596 [Lasiosphaeria miniovina]|uniref:Uncharacterized protein n=1 Tax=Lasiosphaeria miniovina TaxID=1954250 RepID=A0AA40EB02_9PEZI|nr:uncharacterized protein B0T26DRAFT_186596 [Lasiosphaeria miniovina]KAK0728868.1 hypothetical protein B0T26DRAFT_186596 [Lasiosphaeria miniovina]
MAKAVLVVNAGSLAFALVVKAGSLAVGCSLAFMLSTLPGQLLLFICLQSRQAHVRARRERRQNARSSHRGAYPDVRFWCRPGETTPWPIGWSNRPTWSLSSRSRGPRQQLGARWAQCPRCAQMWQPRSGLASGDVSGPEAARRLLARLLVPWTLGLLARLLVTWTLGLLARLLATWTLGLGMRRSAHRPGRGDSFLEALSGLRAAGRYWPPRPETWWTWFPTRSVTKVGQPT